MRKYIVYIGPMEFPSRNAAAQRVLGIARLLDLIGFKIVLHGLNRDLSDGYILKSKLQLFGYDLFELPYPSSITDWAKFLIRTDYVNAIIMRYGVQNIHAIIAYNYPVIAMARIIKLCAKFGIHFISDCTEWYGPSNRKFPSSIIKNLDTCLRMRIINNYGKNIICISDYLATYYSAKHCHIVNIPSLVDHCAPQWRNIDINYKPNNPRTFVYVGSPGKSMEKDRLDWLINVFHRIKIDNIPFIFNIIGISRDNYLSLFPEHSILIEDLKNNVVFHGRLPHEKAIEFIKSADYSVFCRDINRVTSAGFPTKVAESFACGTPVITNQTSNVSRYIINGVNGYLSESCSMEDLYCTISKALHNGDKTLNTMHSFCMTRNPLDVNNFIDALRIFMNDLRASET
ncbi:MAG: glycosyltransferase family 4 protein [Syntrophaceae bacterium]